MIHWNHSKANTWSCRRPSAAAAGDKHLMMMFASSLLPLPLPLLRVCVTALAFSAGFQVSWRHVAFASCSHGAVPRATISTH